MSTNTSLDLSFPKGRYWPDVVPELLAWKCKVGLGFVMFLGFNKHFVFFQTPWDHLQGQIWLC